MNEIPKIQWKNITIAGETTNGSNVITNLASIVGLEVGMIVDHPDFPEGTVIDVVGGGTVDVSEDSTGDTVGPIDFYFEFVFTYPPIKDAGDELNPKGTKKTAFSGATQFNLKYIEIMRMLNFDFLTKDEIDALRIFYNTHASLLDEFRYFEDKDVVDFVAVELSDPKFKPKKTTQTLSKLRIKTRRVE